MPTSPRVSLGDSLIDDAQLAREDMYDLVESAMNRTRFALRQMRDVYDDLTALEADLRCADDAGEGGGELFQVLGRLRQVPGVRREALREAS